jgi:SIR2-like domain
MMSQSISTQPLHWIHAGLVNSRLIPYLGPGVLSLADEPSKVPAAPLELVGKLTAKASVPHKIRTNLSAAAQFIENFKHRKTVTAAMSEAFAPRMAPTLLHRYLAGLPALPLWVHAWYDDLPQQALAQRLASWGIAQGVSQAEHSGSWVHYFDARGSRGEEPNETDPAWDTLLYQPLGSVSPAANYLVSDSDYVEVLTEIDIQTPIPPAVQRLRSGRGFLFIGCRFSSQLERIFAHQIIKRSSDRHFAVLPDEPTRNEKRFLLEHGIERIETPLKEWVGSLIALDQRVAQRIAAS